MATTLSVSGFPLEQTLAQLAQQTRFDDLAALAAVALLSTAYITKGLLWSKPDPYRYKLFERPQQQPGAKAAAPQTRDLAELLEQHQADVAILWASQSGTAERMAARLAKELSSHLHARVVLLDISDVDPTTCAKVPQSKLAIFLASTFGEGDPSDNLHEFWTWLHLPKDTSLSNLQYLAFGLGNSNYKHYNHVINVLADALDARGAKALMPTARADDAAGETEEHFLEWKEHVLEVFQTRLGYQRQAVSYEPSLQVVDDDSLEPIDLHHGIPRDSSVGKATSTQSKVYALPLVQSRELFKDTAGRNCIHMEVDLGEHAELKYRTGDHLGVWPVNPTVEIERLLCVLGLKQRRATPCHVKSTDGSPVKIPSPTSLDAIFEHYVEICAPVSREAVASLAAFAPTEAGAAFLTRISSNKDAYTEYLRSSYVNLGRLLEHACEGEAAWSALPLSLVLETLPAMQPRYYSISSSSVVQARRAAITAVVADTPISTSERVPGLATNYLLALKESSTRPAVAHPHGLTYSLPIPHQPLQASHIHAHIRKSTFKLPAIVSTPIVMVGAGTGVAPFRAFVQERAFLKKLGRDVGQAKLFFGCRNPEQDFIYEEEFTDLASQLGDSFSLVPAFSRPERVEDKRYVQDRIMEDPEAICNLLVDQNAYLYICGSAAMARDVSDAVAKVVMSRQGWSEADMREFADRQKRQKRWMQDVWG
ncbi:hypothetical protein LTR36_010270 [Oleoguttula mirabilis]|uniref:NADPH--cytochrome P450 reductase n=1 Tax=Oleoguttula mirabilis TaxID=1507867 RepID=A0AAV9J5F7_9PEZI|nr:hypothetical protein LTR36_010270 [Oleoguttula mirabilis]